MRTTAKFLTAAALAVLSVSSFASATWTGTLASVKIQYIPSIGGTTPGGGSLILTGTSSSCHWLSSTGAIILASTVTADGDEVRAALAFLSQAKTAGTTVTLTYDNTCTTCDLQNFSR